MAKVKSPNYPTMDLGMALGMARAAFLKDNRNKMSRQTLAKHLGHTSLSGPALSKLGALRAFGLIEGAGDDLRISDDAVDALNAPEGSAEATNAFAKLAFHPKLFQDIRKDFPSKPSADNLKFWLIKRNYAPTAAEAAVKSYLSTLRLVSDDSGSYISPPPKETSQMPVAESILDRPASSAKVPPMLEEVFYLTEGPVTLKYPSAISSESYKDLKAQLELTMSRAQRRAQRTNDESSK